MKMFIYHIFYRVTMKEHVKPGLTSSAGGHLPVYTVSGIKVSVLCHCCHLCHYISTIYGILQPDINDMHMCVFVYFS